MSRGVLLPRGPRPGLYTELAEIFSVVLVQHLGVALGSAEGGELVVEVLVASLSDVDLREAQERIFLSVEQTILAAKEARHFWASLRGEFTVENQNCVGMILLVAIGNWVVIVVLIEKVIDLVFSVQVERPRNMAAIILIWVSAVYDHVSCIGVIVGVAE